MNTTDISTDSTTWLRMPFFISNAGAALRRSTPKILRPFWLSTDQMHGALAQYFVTTLSSVSRSGGEISACLFERASVQSCADLDEQSSIENPNKTNSVAVILGFYNGQQHITEQLQSIFEQSHQALHVYLSDDLSSIPFDLQQVDLDARHFKNLSIGFRQHNVGFTNNFLNALAAIDHGYEYFAFSDQDDIWHQQKLERAIESISSVPSDKPALYCARTEIADASCTTTLGYSPLFNKPPSFENALVQNIGGGNTMVFNKAARDLIVASSLNATVVSHDWWCYQIVTGAGGYVVYDPEPCLKYRQHDNNLVGANASWAARFLRIRELMQGRFSTWNDINLKALSDHRHLLAEKNLRILDDFIEARQAHFFKRLMLFKRSGVYRQTLFDNLGLLLSIVLNRV